MRAIAATGVVALLLAWLVTVGLVGRRSLVCPPQCEVEVAAVGGERLRAPMGRQRSWLVEGRGR